jgi:hypothetical protein
MCKSLISRINSNLNRYSVFVTNAVGTPWCALAFMCISVLATPGVFPAWVTAIAQWIAMAFLQLVLLPIIMVGQNVSSAKTEDTIVDIHRVSLNLQRDMHKNHAKDIRAIHEVLKTIIARLPEDQGDKG